MERQIRWILILMLTASFISTVFFSCSTMPPPTPAYDVKSISGKWEGSADSQRWGRFIMDLEVRPDGIYIMKSNKLLHVNRTQFPGNLWVDGDHYTLNCQTPEMSGTLTLYSQKDSRFLMYRNNDGSISASLRPIYK